MHFGTRNGITDRAALDLDKVTALEARVHAIEREFVRDRIRTVDLRPRPPQHAPRSTDRAADERFDRRALAGIRALIDEDERLAVALVDRAGPVGVDGEVETIERDAAVGPV